MSRKVTVLILISLMISLVIIGCGQVSKSMEFNLYLKSSEVVINKYTEEIKAIEEKITKSNSDKEKGIYVAREEDLTNGVIDSLNKLIRPKELEAYHQKNITYLQDTNKLLIIEEDAFLKKDEQAKKDISDKFKGFHNKDEEFIKELNKLIDQAAKDAGLQVVRNGNKVLFK